MSQQVSQIIADVRKEIDEIGVNTAGFAIGSDNEDLNTIIRHQLAEALRFCYANADVSLIAPDVSTLIAETDFVPVGSGSGQIPMRNLPTGTNIYVGKKELANTFMRLCYARSSSWVRDVTKPILWTEKEAARLSDWLTTGTPERPAVYIDRHGASGALVAYLYTINQGDTAQIAVINSPSYTVSSSESVNIDSRIYGAVVTYCAGLTLLTLKDEHADSLINLALNKMGVKTNETNG